MNAQTTLPAKDFDVTVPHFGMWVGGQHYPTIKAFVNEAKKMGVSKRIAKIPANMVLGKSRIYLAHARKQECIDLDENLHKLNPHRCKRVLAVARKVLKAEKEGQVVKYGHPLYAERSKALGQPLRYHRVQAERVFESAREFVKQEDKNKVVFGYCIVSRIEFIVPASGKVPDRIKKLAADGHVKLIPHDQVAAEPNRGCGKRKPGGIYAVSYEIDAEAMQELRGSAKKVDLMGPLAVYKKPFRAPFKFFRGTKQLEEKLVKRTQVIGKLVGLENEDR